MRFQRRSCSEPCRVAYFGIMTSMIYHICRSEEWAAAETAGRYQGSAQDRADGFIHFSGPDQVEASAAKHRAGQDGLRSEEHTSEIQSLMRTTYAVYCLQKKKRHINQIHDS